MIIFKSPEEIEHIRKASQLTAATLTELAKLVKPGVSTLELDQFAEEYIRSHGGIPSCIGYYGYPATICASINHEVVHGIPSASRILKDGDVISIDLVSSINGYHGDSAITVPVGEVSPKVYALLKVISHAVQSHAERHRYGVVRDFVGHGLGKSMHEDPQVPNYGTKGKGPELRPGMVICIEPMITMGTHKVRVLEDNWTAVTMDRKPAAHFEHTIAITENGTEILTMRDTPRLIQ